MYPGLQLICQVHDEVIYAVPNKHKEEIGILIKYCMEYPWYPLSVPVLASAKLSSSWGAKDDDNIAEIGTFFAVVDNEPRTFTSDNWDEYLKADSEKRVSVKSSCAQLTQEQIDWCQTIVPAEMPPKPRITKPNLITRDQMIASGLR